MACHYLFMKNTDEFMVKLRDRDIDLITKMVKCVISAIKRKRPKIDIFGISFKDHTELIFSIAEDQYLLCLENCLQDLIKEEEYELCALIVKLKQGNKQILDSPIPFNQIATYTNKFSDPSKT